jgi:hypothetical protein
LPLQNVSTYKKSNKSFALLKRKNMEKIIDIIDSIAYEKGLKISEIEEALVESLIKTAEKMIDETLIFDASIDRENKNLKVLILLMKWKLK